MTTLSSAAIQRFIDGQLSVWQLAADNFAALGGVKVKELDVDGWKVKVQFNPARIQSSAAKVDAKSLSERPCFLCEKNRPAVQEGMEWGGRYTVLINPFPIFPRHLTIPDTTHTLQLIKGRIADMFNLARELEDYTVFYNGPKCGASAPDHLHFQAGNSDFLTIGEALADAPMSVIATEGESTLSLCEALPPKVFVIDAAVAAEAEALFDRLYAALPVPDGEPEPMMNILCYPLGSEKVRIVVIPRKRHRPSFYGTEGEGCMLISPASVDMGGVFITPRPDDFERIDADIVRQIFDEVTLTSAEARQIASRI